MCGGECADAGGEGAGDAQPPTRGGAKGDWHHAELRIGNRPLCTWVDRQAEQAVYPSGGEIGATATEAVTVLAGR